MLMARDQIPVNSPPYQRWTQPNGAPFVLFYRTPLGYLLRFPDNADFEITAGNLAVTCAPVPGVPFATCEHLYLNQVAPLVHAGNGKLVLHGSAVVIKGTAMAFIAESGRGKSTIAAAFAVDGCPFLTDDGLQLDFEAAGYLVVPSHPSIRLWEDSHEALLPADASTSPPVHYTSKSRFVAGSELEYRDRSAPLGRIYCLGPGGADAIVIRRMPPSDAVDTLLHHSFILDIEDKLRLGAHFARLASLANVVACFHLDYPRCYSELPRVLTAIRAHAATEVSPS